MDGENTRRHTRAAHLQFSHVHTRSRLPHRISVMFTSDATRRGEERGENKIKEKRSFKPNYG